MTLIIISVLLVLFFAGLIIPQKVFFQSRAQYDAWKATYPIISGIIEFLRFNEMYVAPITIFFLTLFFINLIVVISYRIPVVFRRAYIPKKHFLDFDVERIKNDPNVRTVEISNSSARDISSDVKAFLKKRLWPLLGVKKDRALIAVRNRYSPFGFLFFHLSFMLCLIGGLLVMYTRFSGNLLLTEGQRFDSDIRQFRIIKRDPEIFKALPSLDITLEKVVPRYEGETAVDLDVRMTVKYQGDVEDVSVKINQPIKRGAVAILAENVGVSPLFVLKGKDGKELAGGYFSLNVLKGEEDSFDFEKMPYKFFVRFYPDYAIKDGKEYSLSKELKNPFVHLKIEREGKTVYEGSLGLGESAVFDSMNLFFSDIRYWVDFLFVREYGNVPLYISFLFGAIGLVMRLIFYQKTIRVYIEDKGESSLVYILGQSEYYRYSFGEEMDKLVLDIKAVFGSSAQYYPSEQKEF